MKFQSVSQIKKKEFSQIKKRKKKILKKKNVFMHDIIFPCIKFSDFILGMKKTLKIIVAKLFFPTNINVCPSGLP